MQPEHDDRRTRRTRQLLRDAFVALLKEKRYEDISVQDIIERADVGRSTFYVHYEGKEDLLVGRDGIFVSNLAHQAAHGHVILNEENWLSMLVWFQHIQAQASILKVIARDPAMDIAFKTLYAIIHEDMEKRIAHFGSKLNHENIPTDMIVDYLTDTLMSLIRWWLKNNATLSPQEMDEKFQQLTRGIL
jgi:hypothetical protein